ncbi:MULTISPECIES: VTT domain-containing protein [unclassified Exiguobacterium]|uniref:TVP38/TMEM64 family protein n=1 Tax=unclassified Exiguobacterium TaxID=2644629 RepID=UPI0004DFA6F6|nr:MULTISPECIES: VTT domain-containing protein [unclassified Exiguobacterium]
MIMEWELLPLPLFLMISILLNSVIAVAGVLPSAFLTAINVSVLGLVPGILVSIVGEAVGAIVSFILYRKALHRYVSPNGSRFQRLRESEGAEAWFLVLGMRLMPFVPSGLVTLSAAFSRMTLASFAVASTIGKIPALVMEGLAVTAAMQLTIGWQLFLVGVVAITYLVWRMRQRSGEKM